LAAVILGKFVGVREENPMTNQVIICPHCHKEIPLTEALSHQIKEDLRKEFDAEVKKKEQDLAQKEQGLLKKEKAIEEE